MNIHDQAYALAGALKDSAEYRDFLTAKEALNTDEQGKKMVKDFILKQMAIEYEKMAGKPENPEKMVEIQKLASLVAGNRKANDFFQAYMRFQRIMADIYKIIGDAVAEGMDFIAK